MKKVAKMMTTGFLLGGLVVALSGCAPDSAKGETLQNQTVTVQRGDLTIDVTAVGNLALSHTEALAFDIPSAFAISSSNRITVAEVLVKEGDSVGERQVVAKLDTSEWQKQMSTLEDKVTTAERQLTAKKRDLLQAEINLSNAEIALEETETTYSLADFTMAQVEIRKAKENLEETLFIWSQYGESTPGYELYAEVVLQAEARLKTAENTFEEMLSGFGTREMAIKKLQLEIAQGKLEDAQIAIEDTQKAVADAKEDLAEAKSKSPVITAPFDGFITKVSVEGGDEVMTGTVAVVIADPGKFEADIMVSEMDILRVKVGGTARVTVDAMPGLSLPAKVTHISPTATIQSGVVNYKVKVELESVRPVIAERQEMKQVFPSENVTGGFGQRDTVARRFSQEQAEEMVRQRQSGDTPSSGAGSRGQMSAVIPENFQLREGLTVTVSIIVDNKTNVLLVPNAAIGTQGRQVFVRVLAADGTLEQRPIQTGITDYRFTEVTGGLNEGEQIVVPQAVTTTTATQQQRSQGGMFIPGMGRLR